MAGKTLAARVLEINGNAIHVKFFGDSTTYTTALKNTFSFSEHHDVVLINLRGRKNPLYTKAIKEAETLLGIPDGQSIFKKL